MDQEAFEEQPDQLPCVCVRLQKVYRRAKLPDSVFVVDEPEHDAINLKKIS
jgi:hypothetical protein